MRVIATVNLKGGVGKSSTAINLAVCFHRDGVRTLIVDADSQGTARTWASAAKEGADGPPVIGMDARNMVRDLPKIGEGYDLVVIDTPARLGKEARAAMLMADLVLLPIIPGAADIWALQETITVLEDARGLKPDLEARIVLNQADNTNLGALVVEQLKEFDIGVLNATIGHRVAFREAMLNGQGVIDWEPGSTAADEMRALHRQVKRLLGDEPPRRSRTKPEQSTATAGH